MSKALMNKVLMSKVIQFIVAAFNEGYNGGAEFPQTDTSNWK